MIYFYLLNPNKAGLFESIFLWGLGGWGGGGVKEELKQYKYNFIQLLSTLFRVY